MKKALLIIAACLTLFAVATGCFNLVFYYKTINSLTLNLNGDSDITWEYGYSFTDSGAEASYYDYFNNRTVCVPVESQGDVNTEQLGDYRITYSAQNEDVIRTASRNVHVVDTEAPQIQLVSDPESYTLPNHPYEEEGYIALDNHDGDITGQVLAKEENGVVTYTVTDASGNTTSVTREIRYFDPSPPELTLNGSDIIVLTAGSPFEDPGWTATDDCDGDLTEAVKISGNLDTDRNGAYTLTYTVSDTFGNVTTAERTVYVVQLDVTDESVVKNGKYIYLTFDDGPSNYTGRLLDILAKYNVKATFFVVNTGNIGITARAAAEGHTVAMHSATHRFEQIYASDEAYIADLQRMEEIIFQNTGQRNKMFRFPGGSSNTTSCLYNTGIMSRLTKTLTDMGYQYFDWNVDSKDAGGATSSKEVFNNVIKGISSHNTSIVLQHDTTAYSVNAVENIIGWGLAHGYTFAPLTFNCPTSHHGVRN